MISQAEYLAMQMRCGPKARLPLLDDINDAQSEAGLQEQIIRDARGRGWWVHFSRMDLPTTSPLGSMDLIIFCDKGRVILIEAKSKRGKVRPEQLGVKLMLEKLGHTVHIVRSFGEYLKLI